MELGMGDDGLSWERNPVKHRVDAKKLAPAFSAKSMKAKEPTMHKYIDAFVQRMRELGDRKDGIELKTVSIAAVTCGYEYDSRMLTRKTSSGLTG